MLTCWCIKQVGRAGRFGTKGLAITFSSSDEDAKVLDSVQQRFEVNITELPEKACIVRYKFSSFELQRNAS